MRTLSVGGVRIVPRNLTTAQRRALQVLERIRSTSVAKFGEALWPKLPASRGRNVAAVSLLTRLQTLRLVETGKTGRRWRLTRAGRRIARQIDPQLLPS